MALRRGGVRSACGVCSSVVVLSLSLFVCAERCPRSSLARCCAAHRRGLAASTTPPPRGWSRTGSNDDRTTSQASERGGRADQRQWTVWRHTRHTRHRARTRAHDRRRRRRQRRLGSQRTRSAQRAEGRSESKGGALQSRAPLASHSPAWTPGTASRRPILCARSSHSHGPRSSTHHHTSRAPLARAHRTQQQQPRRRAIQLGAFIAAQPSRQLRSLAAVREQHRQQQRRQHRQQHPVCRSSAAIAVVGLFEHAGCASC